MAKKTVLSKGAIEVPAEYNTPEKIMEYCKKKGITYIHERWIYNQAGAKK